MDIVMLNGNPKPEAPALDDYLAAQAQALEARGHRVEVLTLRELKINSCTGCWACWVKTPGECVIPDDGRAVARAVINADFALFASPVIMGFYSALLKLATDRLIPLIHPYIEFVEGESHHRARYEQYPPLGLLLEKGPAADDEDVAIITHIHGRTALNFKSRLVLSKLTCDPLEEVADAIDAI